MGLTVFASFVAARRDAAGTHLAPSHKRYRPTKLSTKGELEALGFTKARSFAHDMMHAPRRGAAGRPRVPNGVRHRSGRGQMASVDGDAGEVVGGVGP
jgi:hypothetical protein